MDLSSVEYNLRSGAYSNSQQFATDIRRIWLNAFKYNDEGSEMFYITLELVTYFERQFRKIENLRFGLEERRMQRDKQALREYMSSSLSVSEKRILSSSIRFLLKNSDMELKDLGLSRSTINIDKLSVKTCRSLEKIVKLRYQAMCRSHRHLSQKSIITL